MHARQMIHPREFRSNGAHKLIQRMARAPGTCAHVAHVAHAAHVAHVAQSRPDSGLSFEANIIDFFYGVHFSLGGGRCVPPEPGHAFGRQHLALSELSPRRVVG